MHAHVSMDMNVRVHTGAWAMKTSVASTEIHRRAMHMLNPHM